MMVTCRRCGYEWEPHTRGDGSPNDPRACPSCKSYQWRKEAKSNGEKKED